MELLPRLALAVDMPLQESKQGGLTRRDQEKKQRNADENTSRGSAGYARVSLSDTLQTITLKLLIELPAGGFTVPDSNFRHIMQSSHLPSWLPTQSGHPASPRWLPFHSTLDC